MYPHQLYRSRREAALDEHFRHWRRLDHGIVQAAQGEATALRAGIVETIASKNSNVGSSERRGQLAAVGALDESGELLQQPVASCIPASNSMDAAWLVRVLSARRVLTWICRVGQVKKCAEFLQRVLQLVRLPCAELAT